MPFYRVNALSSDGFIGEGSNGNEGDGGSPFPRRVGFSRFFAKTESSLWSRGGRVYGKPGNVAGVAEGRPSSPRARSRPPEDQFRDTDTTTRNMETPL